MIRSSAAVRPLASLCLASLLLAHVPAASAQPKKPAPTVSDAAKKHFQAGVDLLTDPDGARYEEALREFRAAYADSPSWKILSNLGLSAMKLERNGEAIEVHPTGLRINDPRPFDLRRTYAMGVIVPVRRQMQRRKHDQSERVDPRADCCRQTRRCSKRAHGATVSRIARLGKVAGRRYRNAPSTWGLTVYSVRIGCGCTTVFPSLSYSSMKP